MKKKRIIIVCSVIIALVIGYFGILHFRKNSVKAAIIPVSSLNMGFQNMDSTMNGMVSDPATQSVVPASSQVIKEVYVSEGQSVAVGDKLLAYDVSSINITLELKKVDISNGQIKIEQAKRELERLKNTRPIEKREEPEPAPIPDPTVDVSEVTQEEKDQVWNYIDALDNEDKEFTKDLDTPMVFGPIVPPEPDPSETPAVPAPGTSEDTMIQSQFPENTYEQGTKANPYHFAVKQDGFVSGKFIKELAEKAEQLKKAVYVSFDFYQEDNKEKALEDSWLVSIDKLKNILRDESHERAKVDMQTRALRMITPEVPEVVPEIIPEGMTALELTRAIHAKEAEIRNLDINIRRDQLTLSELQSQLADGIVYAKRSGIVKGLHDIGNVPIDGTPFLTVVGGSGTEVKGSISELLLNTISTGTVVNVINYENGSTYQAEITQIDNFPQNRESNSFYGSGNPNSSMYGFTAYIETADDLKQNTYLALTIVSENEMKNSIYLDNAFIRDDHGKKYVMKDVGGKLEKTYVTTGKVFYNMSTEILSGLTNDDFIAFPYGNGAVEGAQTTMEMGVGGMY